MLEPGALARSTRAHGRTCRWRLVAVATLMVIPGCGGKGSADGKRTLPCGPQLGLASPNYEVEAIELGDSLAAWLSAKRGFGPYAEVQERLRAQVVLMGISNPATVEGHAFLRALTSLGADEWFVGRLARTLREELRAGRLTLRNVTPATGGPDRAWYLVANALYGLPDSLLIVADAGAVLCHEMQRILPLFVRGYASDLGDLGRDTGPFVGTMNIVYGAGPVGRGIVDSIIRAAEPFPGLSGFVRRVAAGLDTARSSERPL